MNRSHVLKTLTISALLALSACASQSVGPGGVEQSAGPFHQSVGPGGVNQGAGSYGPGQSAGPGGVQQGAGPYGPSQSVGPGGVNQSAGSPRCLNAGCKWENGGTSAGANCRATCAGNEYAISCPATERAVCQCGNPPYASCAAPHR